ncbi:MAG: CDP-alcohol phosphatidyltransferase family protein [Phycisphaeraceae bacterium]
MTHRIAETPAPQAPSAWHALVTASRKGGGPLYTYYINRSVAIPFTFMFWRLGLAPNHVSIISSLVTHAGLALLVLAPMSLPLVVGVWALLALGFALDSCDGQLARVSGQRSQFGAWLDHSLDMVKMLTVQMVLGYVILRESVAADLALWPVLLAIFINLLVRPAHFFNTETRALFLPGVKTQANTEKSAARLFISTLADYGLFILIVLLLPWPAMFTAVYLIAGVFFALIYLAYAVRLGRQLKAHDRMATEATEPKESAPGAAQAGASTGR